MAAPDGNVYVEIQAPDLRFVFIGAMLLATLWFTWRKPKQLQWATLCLLALVALAFVPWLLTSGNGRYFIPFLLCAGPVCIALLYWLPVTKGLKGVLAILMLAAQGYVVVDANPLERWGLARWHNAPYFGLVVPIELLKQPHTFVTMTSISYSLVAPQFSPDSRWIDIVNLPDASSNSPVQIRAKELLSQSTSLKLLLPVVPGHATKDGLPSEASKAVIATGLAAQRLGFAPGGSCQFLYSSGMSSLNFGARQDVDAKVIAQSGFWVCDLQYGAEAATVKSNKIVDLEANKVLEKLEANCPRLFAPGQKTVYPTEGGVTRGYPDSDMKLFILMVDGVYYKYWKALNPVRIGSIQEVLSDGFKMDCNNIRGRSGLPWEREI